MTTINFNLLHHNDLEPLEELDDTLSTDEMLAWIAQADYEMLLRKWRFASVGNAFFMNDVVFNAFKKKMKSLRKANPSQASKLRKYIGWGHQYFKKHP